MAEAPPPCIRPPIPATKPPTPGIKPPPIFTAALCAAGIRWPCLLVRLSAFFFSSTTVVSSLSTSRRESCLWGVWVPWLRRVIFYSYQVEGSAEAPHTAYCQPFLICCWSPIITSFSPNFFLFSIQAWYIASTCQFWSGSKSKKSLVLSYL